MNDQWFWEQCGFKQLEAGRGGYHYAATKKVWNWLLPNETERHKSIPFLPPKDLSNLWEYAVPELKKRYRNWKSVLHDWVDGLTGDYKKDALSLYEIIYKVFEAKDE